MPKKSAGLLPKAFAVLAKDMRLELRSRHALNAIFLFAVTSLVVVSFSLGQAGLSAKLNSALFWIVMFFSAMSALARVFVGEEETGTAMTLRLFASPESVYIGKLSFNLLLLLLLTVVLTPLFLIFTQARLDNPALLAVVLFLGVLGLCGGTTLVAAIIARASSKNALFAVLSFPVLMPLLLVLVRATEKAFAGQSFADASTELQFLFAYVVVMIVGSVMLFKFVWVK